MTVIIPYDCEDNDEDRLNNYMPEKVSEMQGSVIRDNGFQSVLCHRQWL